MDCPNYELTLYVDDTRLHNLIGYTLDGDAHLARRCIELFDWSRRGFGFTNSTGPLASRWCIHGVASSRVCYAQLFLPRSLADQALHLGLPSGQNRVSSTGAGVLAQQCVGEALRSGARFRVRD